MILLVRFGWILLVAVTAWTTIGQSAHAAGRWQWPLEGQVITSFSSSPNRFAGGVHRGVDIAAPVGSPVQAPISGTITYTGTIGKNGVIVSMRSSSGKYLLSFVHLGSARVAKGVRVKTGDLIALSGASGDLRGLQPHVHFGTRVANTRAYVDPLSLLKARARALPVESPEQPPAQAVPAPVEAPARSPVKVPKKPAQRAPKVTPKAAPLAPPAQIPAEVQRPAAARPKRAGTNVRTSEPGQIQGQSISAAAPIDLVANAPKPKSQGSAGAKSQPKVRLRPRSFAQPVVGPISKTNPRGESPGSGNWQLLLLLIPALIGAGLWFARQTRHKNLPPPLPDDLPTVTKDQEGEPARVHQLRS